MMRIETYTSNKRRDGKQYRYYRAIIPGYTPVHLGSADKIFRRVIGVDVAKWKKTAEKTANSSEVEKENRTE